MAGHEATARLTHWVRGVRGQDVSPAAWGTCPALVHRCLLCRSTIVCSSKRWTCRGGSSPRTRGAARGSIRPRGRRAPLPNSSLVFACGDDSCLVPPAAGHPLAVRSGRASARRERGSGRHRRASWRDGPGRPPTGRRWPRLDFPPGLTGCAGTRRSAAGTKESSDCGSLRRGSRSPGGWSRRAPRRQARPSRCAGAGSAPR